MHFSFHFFKKPSLTLFGLTLFALFLSACAVQQSPQDLQDIRKDLSQLEIEQHELRLRVQAIEQQMVQGTGAQSLDMATQVALPSGPANSVNPVDAALAESVSPVDTALATQERLAASHAAGQAAGQAQVSHQNPQQAPPAQSAVPAPVPTSPYIAQSPNYSRTQLLPSPDAEIAAGKYRLIDPNKKMGTIAPQKPTQRSSVQPSSVPSPTRQSQTLQSPRPTSGIEQEYGKALQAYRNGQYQAAISAFEALIKKYPNHNLATNALYWTGESLYSLGQDIEAIFTFKNLINAKADHAKVPDALLKTALSYNRLGDAANAQAHLQVLAEDYPNSPARQRATQLGLYP